MWWMVICVCQFVDLSKYLSNSIIYSIIKLSDSYQIRNTENIRSDIKNAESYIKVEGEYYIFRVGLVG